MRTCGQHPGRMSRAGVGWVIFMSLVFYMFQSILGIFVFFLLFLVGKINYFHRFSSPPDMEKVGEPVN